MRQFFLVSEARFPGGSAIVAAGGNVLALMNDQPGVAVANVTFDPDRKIAPAEGFDGELIPDLTKFNWRGAS